MEELHESKALTAVVLKEIRVNNNQEGATSDLQGEGDSKAWFEASAVR